MSIADELERLNALRQSGALSEDEYQRAKQSTLAQQASAGNGSNGTSENVWAMFIHLSQFCGYAVPLAGFIVPLVLWQVKKNESPFIDANGRIVMNWMISVLVFAVLFGLLSFVGVGIIMLAILALLMIVFPIVGGIKANNGEVWRYPFSIHFFALDRNQ